MAASDLGRKLFKITPLKSEPFTTISEFGAVKNFNYTMVLNGSTVQSYGRLLNGGDFKADHHCKPGHGLLVLRIQAKNLLFLHQCAQLILLETNTGAVMPRELTTTPSQALQHRNYTSVASLASEAPYLAPQTIDLRQLLPFVYARKAQAEDHI